IAGHPNLVVLRELLSAEHQHRMIEPSLANRGDDIRIELLAEIDAADFGADMLGERNDVDPCPGCDGHGAFLGVPQCPDLNCGLSLQLSRERKQASTHTAIAS